MYVTNNRGFFPIAYIYVDTNKDYHITPTKQSPDPAVATDDYEGYRQWSYDLFGQL